MDTVASGLLTTRRSLLKGSILGILGAATMPGAARAEEPSNISGHEVNRAVVLTDIHIGWGKSNIEETLENGVWDEIVKRHKPNEMIFLGDVFDLWRNKKLEKVPYKKFLERLDAFGGKISYVIGNHDYHLLKVLEGDKDDPEGIGERLRKRGVVFYHPFYQFQNNGRNFICTHGDNFDFLYWFEVLEKPPEPVRVYEEFYEVVYGDNEIAREWDQQGFIRGALRWFHKWFKRHFGLPSFLAFFEEFQQYLEDLKDLESPVERKEELEVLGLRTKIRERYLDLLELFHKKDLDLKRVQNHKLPKSIGWKENAKGWKFYHPFNELKGPEYFSNTPDIVLIGHYHDPRVFTHWNDGKLITISDVGACAEGKLSYGTIIDGEYKLYHEKL